MKNFCKLAMLVLASCVMVTSTRAQVPPAPDVALSNIVEGVGTIAGSNPGWAGQTELVLIPGSELLGVKATTNFLSIGFFGGSTVDIGHMVMYKTARNSTKVVSVKNVLLGAVASPSINLTSPSVCPDQPVSITSPCLIKLDVVKGALSPLFDYYFAIYLTNDSNNTSALALGNSSAQGGLSGYQVLGDQTRIKKNGSLPPGYFGASPYFLMFVTNQ